MTRCDERAAVRPQTPSPGCSAAERQRLQTSEVFQAAPRAPSGFLHRQPCARGVHSPGQTPPRAGKTDQERTRTGPGRPRAVLGVPPAERGDAWPVRRWLAAAAAWVFRREVCGRVSWGRNYDRILCRMPCTWRACGLRGCACETWGCRSDEMPSNTPDANYAPTKLLSNF